MIRTGWLSARAAIVLGAVVAAACTPRQQTGPVAVAPQPPPVAAESPVLPSTPPPVVDPAAALLATAQRHFEAGRKEWDLGHLERAKAEFDLALRTLLESPAGARSDPRMRERSIGWSTGSARTRCSPWRRATASPSGVPGRVDRRPALDLDVRHHRALRRPARRRRDRPGPHDARHRDSPQRPRPDATSSCSRGGCATGSRARSCGAHGTCR